MRALRLANLILLVLVLVAGTTIMASARHQVGAVGEVVICTGYGLTTIAVDAEGNPVPGRLILCPDCVPALAALTDAPNALPGAPDRLVPASHARIDRAMPQPAAPAHRRSRAPPSCHAST